MDRAGQGSLQERTRGWFVSAIIIRSECDFLRSRPTIAIIPGSPVKRLFPLSFDMYELEPVRVPVCCNVTAGDDNIGQQSHE